ncbi:regulator (plasmid) [Borreliella mayonii]|uniref:Regulator n=1 Tax=Borreliella mayonii TaxID=1674146 RepID=A0AAC9KV93_9SPIR|nr:complement regulator-acquiring protein [Borreliella mayonii]APS99358.1 regulator [Borreliella mayonii]APT00492.1 regulator [Borreliella mayonii]
MTKFKLDVIRLNIITAILALICISCTANPIDPKANGNIKPKNNINTKKNTNLEKNTQNFENESENPRSYNQKLLEATIKELKVIGKNLEDQRKEENIQIAKIVDEKFDFLGTFKVGPYDIIEENQQMKMKRIIYSSLNYKKEKIETLKEILETLKNNPEHQYIAGRLANLSWSIQFKIDDNFETIQNGVDNLDQEKSESLLMRAKSNLQLKERFKKTLNETLEAYSQNAQNIKNDIGILAEHVNKYYKYSDSLKPIFY